MIPVMLDPSEVSVAVVGRGSEAARRVRQLAEGGAKGLAVFNPKPGREDRDVPGITLYERLPEGDDFVSVSLVYFAGLDADAVEPLAKLARQHGALINVEDVTALCDFHVPGVIRRGDLLITVSTGGKSPGLARRLREDLEAEYGPEWAERLDTLGDARRVWLDEGKDVAFIADSTNAMIDRRGWLR